MITKAFRLALLILPLFSPMANALSYKVTGVDGSLKKNIDVYLQAQQFSQNASSTRISFQSTEQARQALRALGYYQSNIAVQVNGDSVNVQVQAGEPLRISEYQLRFDGQGQNDPLYKQVLLESKIKQGAILNHAHYEQFKSQLARVASSYGYFDARYLRSEVLVSLSDNTARVFIHYDSGQRYRFGEVIFLNQSLPRGLFLKLANFYQGQYYDTQLISDYNHRLGQTDYFKVVSVRADIANRKDDLVNIMVALGPRPKDTFELGGGITSDVGLRGSFKWQRPWVNSKGHSMGVETEISAIRQSGAFSYRIPMGDPIDDYFDLQVGYIREDTNDTQSDRLVASVNRQWIISEDWKGTAFIRWEREEYTQAEQSEQSYLMLPGLNASRLRSRDGLDPYWGDRTQGSIEFSHSAWRSDVDLIKATFLTKWLRTFKRHRVIARADLGGIWVDDVENVPASMRFFAGGDQSVRGYDYKTISPTDDQGQLIGGRYLVSGGMEYNYQFAQSWRAAAFIDVGTATNDFSETLSKGLGLGLRWLTPIGPLRIDVATGLQNDSDSWRLHFSLGPDL